MKRFEYLIQAVKGNVPLDQLTEELNRLGNLGWELVSVKDYPEQDQTTMYFKREIAYLY